MSNDVTGALKRIGRALGRSDLRALVINGAAAALVLVGSLVLSAWAIDLEWLRLLSGGGLRMKANVALALIAAGLTLLCLTRRRPEPAPERINVGALVLSILTLAIAIATLAEYAFGPPWSIDQWLLPDVSTPPVGAWTQIAFYRALPGRMAPYTALALMAAGFAHGLIATGWRETARWPARASLLLGFLLLLGVAWNVTDRWLPPLPLTTVLALFVLGAGTTVAAGGARQGRCLSRQLRFGIEARVLGASVLVALLLLGAGRFAYTAADGFVAASEKLADRQAARIQVGRAFAALNNVESSQRAYLLTGAPRFRAEFTRFRSDARSLVGALPKIAHVDPRNAELIAQMSKLADERLRLLDKVDVAFDGEGLDAARELAAMGEGSLLVAQLRGLMDRLDIAVAQGVVQAQKALTHSRRVTLFSFLVTLGGSVAILAFVFGAVRREMIKRTSAQAALASSNEQLERARIEADQANQAKSAFLAAMSHEIRTPMNGVVGMVEVLAHTRLSAEQADAVRTIRDSGRSLLQLIDEILDFSKIDSGRVELERSRVVVSQIAEGVLRTLSPLAAVKAVDLHLRVDPGLPDAAWGDPTRLRQLLYNLVGNAIKFSAGTDVERGAVHVHIEPLHGTVDSLRLRVVDDGIGMSEEVQQRLFRPFAQGEASTTRRFGGTGLGLVICQRIVVLMGGTIAITSAEGAGATVEIILPLEPFVPAADLGTLDDASDARQRLVATAGRIPIGKARAENADALVAARQAPTVEEARVRGELLLVAEDDPVNQKVVLKQLALLGFAAEVAGDGAEALRLWRQTPYAALLTDLHMPEMDGQALARAIRAEEAPDQRKPIVALSADALRSTEIAALDAGIDRFLSKPVQLWRLREALEQCLGQRTSRDGEDGPASNAPLDRDRLVLDVAALEALVGTERAVVAEFLADFARSLPCLEVELEAAWGDGKMRNVETLAHRLKSTARSMGASALGDTCAELEASMQTRSTEEIGAAVQRVCIAIGDIVPVIEEYVESLQQDAEAAT
ncbi:MAG TPA: ATP-binding protein [Caldimonas sp.]|nr:ATP-binding protein [Caldimonas sp.]